MSLVSQSVRIDSFSGPYFPAFGLSRRDTEYLSVFSLNVGKYCIVRSHVLSGATITSQLYLEYLYLTIYLKNLIVTAFCPA